MVSTGALEATTDTASAVAASDVVVVVVPLYADAEGKPERPRSTRPPRHGRRPAARHAGLDKFLPWAPRATGSHRGPAACGVDLFVVFSPKRVSIGVAVFADLARYPNSSAAWIPRADGGRWTWRRPAVRRTPMRRSNGVWDLGSAEAAEFAKLAETTYRDVNIGLANQFALYAEHGIGVDFRRMAEACNSQPFSHLHAPGIAVGGHSSPVPVVLPGRRPPTRRSSARPAPPTAMRTAVGGWPTSTVT